MRSTFAGLEIARRSLVAQQAALHVTGHNIANANTPGYTRQAAVLRATSPYTVPGKDRPHVAGQMGTGVEVAMIQRIGDEFIQAELTKEAATTGYWQSRQQILRQMEVALMEPSDSGVQAAFERYWSALQELTKAPESHAVRSLFVEEAVLLTQTLQNVRSQLVPMQQELDQKMQRTAEHLNNLAAQIASLNEEIAHAKVVGYEPNDLLDQRDLLVQEVSQLSGATVATRANGMIAVVLGGVTLVDGNFARSIGVEQRGDGSGFIELVWNDTKKPVHFPAGQLRSDQEARDQLIPERLLELDTLAAAFIAESNAIHRLGVGLNGATGYDLFLGTDASNIAFNPQLANSIESIGASATGEPGDSSIALQLAQLSQKPVLGQATFDSYFTSIVSGVGILSHQAERMVEHQSDVENHLKTLRASVAGVNLDEEMTNMVRLQHAYAAAARVMSAMDEALETLIQRMGLVGR